jgi:hypothetical protein
MMNSGNKWVDIRLFEDANSNNTVDEGEAMFWSIGNPPHFNNWGGVLRIGGETCQGTGEEQQCFWQDQIVVPGGTYDGPDFDITPP